jgi:hypothetical protein
MLLTLNTLYIMSFDQETNDYQGYKPLLENYTTYRGITHKPQLKHTVLLISARENARGSQDKITKELWTY